MFSVLRRFAYHPDRVRVTFTHFSELNLVAIRRVYLGLLEAGMEPAVARKLVESVAYRARRGNADFIQMLAEDDEVMRRLSVERISEIRNEVWQASQANARRAIDARVHRRGGGPEQAREDRLALVRGDGAEEPRRDLRRRRCRLRLPRGHRPEPDHRPEPGINRRRRVRHAQATEGVNR